VPRSRDEVNAAGDTLISPHYFETMGTHIVAGRAIDERDTAESKKVAVINETMARRYCNRRSWQSGAVSGPAKKAIQLKWWAWRAMASIASIAKMRRPTFRAAQPELFRQWR